MSKHTHEQDWACTDTGNKERFVKQWEGKALFLRERRQWIEWNGEQWAPDTAIYAKAEETAKSIFVEASTSRNKIEIGRWAVTSQSTGRLRSMLERAQEPLGVSITDFDTDPHLINCQNGVLDLRSKQLRKHSPDDRFLQMASVNYTPEAECPTWLSFLKDVHEDDKQTISYLQLLYGYSTTGVVKDHHFVIFHGNGRNGKDTELGTVRKILGDYGIETSFDIFLEDGGSKVREMEAMGNMKGKRFTAASEAERNRAFNSALIKAYTGGNQRDGAVLHGSRFKYDPTDKLWLSTNYLPHVKDTTVAFWDRVIVVPFNRQYLDGERDTNLRDKLWAERDGIFAWLVEGAHRYLAGGKLYERPACVEKATKEYELSNDDLKRFIAECMVKDNKSEIGVQRAFDRYTEWFNGSDHTVQTQACPIKFFRERMGKRGLRYRNDKGSMFFTGWKLADSGQPSTTEIADFKPHPAKPSYDEWEKTYKPSEPWESYKRKTESEDEEIQYRVFA